MFNLWSIMFNLCSIRVPSMFNLCSICSSCVLSCWTNQYDSTWAELLASQLENHAQSVHYFCLWASKLHCNLWHCDGLYNIVFLLREGLLLAPWCSTTLSMYTSWVLDSKLKGFPYRWRGNTHHILHHNAFCSIIHDHPAWHCVCLSLPAFTWPGLALLSSWTWLVPSSCSHWLCHHVFTVQNIVQWVLFEFPKCQYL